MSVTLSPSGTLGFQRPLTRLVPQVLSVHNPNSQPIVFKIKTTAPRAFSVRPNAASVAPGESLEVHIVLQPLPEEPPLGSKSRDKFLVQSALYTPDREQLGIHSVWSSVPAEEVTEQKVRVAWLGDTDASTTAAAPAQPHAGSDPATAGAAGAAGVTGAAAGAGLGAGLGSAPAASSPAAGLGGTTVGDTSADQTVHSVVPPPTYSAGDASRAPPLSEKTGLDTSTAAGAGAGAGAGAITGSPAELNARISQLQRQLAAAQAEKGMPVQQVAIVAALVFFLTYLFF